MKCVTNLGIERISTLILTGKPNKPLPAQFNIDIEEFNAGAVAAIEVVTLGLADGDYASLEGLVTDQCVSGLKEQNLELLSEEKRKLLAVNSSDIFFNMLADIKLNPSYCEVLLVTFSFPQLGKIKMMNKEVKKSKKEFDAKMEAAAADFKKGVTDQHQFKEITEDNIKEFKESVASNNIYQLFQENEILIGNYRFVRDDTSSNWTISQISQVNSVEAWHWFTKTKWKGRLSIHLRFGVDFDKLLRYDYLSDWIILVVLFYATLGVGFIDGIITRDPLGIIIVILTAKVLKKMSMPLECNFSKEVEVYRIDQLHKKMLNCVKIKDQPEVRNLDAPRFDGKGCAAT